MSYTVLIVDDDVFMLDILRFYLARAGYKVLEASDGKQALKLITKSKPKIDLIMTDLHMPYMSGIELADALKKSKAYGNIPMILITSDTDVVDKFAHDDQYKTFDDSLNKPVMATEMLHKVQQLLGNKQQVA
jgi:CheY-like chemotaxis protein